MEERRDAILRHSENKILHVGCVGEYLWLDNLNHDIWIHQDLIDKFGAENVVGIDAYKEGVEQLQQDGYEVYLENAEEFELDEKFDTIAAPQMLHHLSNPGKALECFNNHLKPDGKVVIAHPNHFFIERQLLDAISLLGENVGEKQSYKEYTGHTCCHKPEHLFELFSRYGFEPETAYFLPAVSEPDNIVGHIWHNVALPLANLALPDRFSKKTFVGVFR